MRQNQARKHITGKPVTQRQRAADEERQQKAFDLSKLANLGRLVAMDYARWRKSTERMVTEIQDAMDVGLSTEEIEAALLGRCTDKEQMQDVLATLAAMVQMGRLGHDFDAVARKGIRPQRI